MKKKKVFQVSFETVCDKPSVEQMQCIAFDWGILRRKYAFVVADDIEGALLFARQNFAALTSKLEFPENERPVDIKEISLYKDEVYA